MFLYRKMALASAVVLGLLALVPGRPTALAASSGQPAQRVWALRPDLHASAHEHSLGGGLCRWRSLSSGRGLFILSIRGGNGAEEGDAVKGGVHARDEEQPPRGTRGGEKEIDSTGPRAPRQAQHRAADSRHRVRCKFAPSSRAKC